MSIITRASIKFESFFVRKILEFSLYEFLTARNSQIIFIPQSAIVAFYPVRNMDDFNF